MNSITVVPVSAKPVPCPAPHPKQVKLLGAFVWSLGVITSVSAQLGSCFVFIEDSNGKEHHRFVVDLNKAEVIFPREQQPYVTSTRRISYGLWAEMHDLAPLTSSAAVSVAA